MLANKYKKETFSQNRGQNIGKTGKSKYTKVLFLLNIWPQNCRIEYRKKPNIRKEKISKSAFTIVEKKFW